MSKPISKGTNFKWGRLICKNATLSEGQDASSLAHVAGDNLRMTERIGRLFRISNCLLLQTFYGSQIREGKSPVLKICNYELE